MLRNDMPVFLKGKMAGVEQVEFEMLQIPLVRVCTRRREDPVTMT